MRFYRLVIGFVLILFGLCAGVMFAARGTDSGSSCLYARDSKLLLNVDANQGRYLLHADPFSDPAPDITMKASPDMHYLAYVRHDSTDRVTIYIREWSGLTYSRPTPILDNLRLQDESTFIYIAWSPDNQWMLVSWLGEDGNSENRILDPSGKAVFTGPALPRINDWGWTGDSAYYVFTVNSQLLLWDRATHQYRNTGVAAENSIPAPSGHRIAIVSTLPDGKSSFVMYSPGENEQHSFPLPDDVFHLEPTLFWSPDGLHAALAMLTDQGRGDGFSLTRLDVYNVDGTSIQHFDESENDEMNQSADMGPTLLWSPDSRRIIYEKRTDQQTDLVDFDVSTQSTEILAANSMSGLQLVGNTYTVISQGAQRKILNLMTGRSYPFATPGWQLQVSPDERLLISDDGPIIRLINLQTSQTLSYAPRSQVFEHRAIWSADSQQVAVLYRDNQGYVLDIVSADGSLRHRLDLAGSDALRSSNYWWNSLRWTSCWG